MKDLEDQLKEHGKDLIKLGKSLITVNLLELTELYDKAWFNGFEAGTESAIDGIKTSRLELLSKTDESLTIDFT